MLDPLLHPARLLLLATLALLLAVALLQFTAAAPQAAAPASAVAVGAPHGTAPAQAAAPAPAKAAAPAPAPAAAAALPAPSSAAPVSAATPAPVSPAATEQPPGELVAEDPGPPTGADVEERRRGGVPCAEPHLLARVDRATVVRAQPGGRQVGSVPATSAYLGQPTVAWVQATTDDGRWGRVTLPWSKPVGRSGWISLDGIATTGTRTMLVADLSRREITAYRGCRPLFSVRSAIGRPGSPSPTGRFWVTDRVAVPAAQQDSFGTFAFGLSTVQPNLPAGWTGGDQMAIHGTGAPGSIGEAASAGCLRVSEDALRRLKPLLDLGTPVVIQA